MPAECAARMPLPESSTAAHRTGSTSSRRAASRYTSGAGLPRSTSSDETVARKWSAIPAAETTASIASGGDVAVLPVDEARPRLAFLERDDLTDEEGVIARVVVGPDPAFDPRECIGEERCACHAFAHADVLPEDDRRSSACEMGGEIGLVSAQDRDAERAGAVHELVQRELAAD